MTTPIQFSVAIARGDNSNGQSFIWRQQCYIQIRDAQLEELERLMKNKALRGEADALRFNARRYLELIDKSIEGILDEDMSAKRRMMSKINAAAAGAIIIATLSGFWPVPVTLSIFVVVAILNRQTVWRCQAIEEFLKARREGIEDRIDQICSTWWKDG